VVVCVCVWTMAICSWKYCMVTHVSVTVRLCVCVEHKYNLRPRL
jgi:hypothetical protein